jgi:hypothetical protein
MKLFTKISHATREWNLRFNLLEIYLHDGDGCWGFSFCEVIHNYRPYSLLSIEFMLPNGKDLQKFKIMNWDFLYLSNYIIKWLNELDENIAWGYKPNRFQKFMFNNLKKLF